MKKFGSNIFIIFCVYFIQILNGNKIKSETKLDRISLNGKWYVDSAGRVKIFHGINAVEKAFPWIPNNPNVDMTNNTQLSNLKKWGFNVVRLGVMWSGVMPAKNFTNQTYLNEIVHIVNNLASYGIYTIVDLHQDMMSTKFDSYDGVPLWVLDEMPKSRSSYPWPLTNKTIQVSGFASYLTEACGFSFQCLYQNTNEVGEYFNQYWSIIARTFANNTSILGYELINEPWAGDIYADPFLLVPSIAGSHNLLAFYDRAYEAIRKYDSETLVFYEPVTWGVLTNKGTGFNRAPGNDVKKTVFSWHYYCWLLALDQNPIKNYTYPEFYRVLCDRAQLYDAFDVVKNDMLEIGNGASFLTEFGVCAFGDPTGKNPNFTDTEECEAVLNANDKYLTSWTYWDSNFYHVEDSFKIKSRIIDIFSRVYPISTNGVPKHMEFNTNTKEFHYTFTIESGLNLGMSTEIFIPSHVYPSGFDVNLSPGLESSFDSSSSILSIRTTNSVYTQSKFIADLSIQVTASN